MKKNLIVIIILAILIVITGLWIYSSSNTNKQSYSNTSPATPTTSSNQASTTPATQNSSGSGRQLFSDSPLAQYAYLISTKTYDAKTEQALSGFTVIKNNLAGGSMEITLKAQNPEYHTQAYIVKPGEKLYFIEKSLSDDNGTNDRFLGDDSTVLVDADGYIIEQQ